MNPLDQRIQDTILEHALEQELRGERPPDLTERVLAAAGRPAPSAPARATPGWLAAALVVAALGLVVLIWAWSRDGDVRRTADSDGQVDPLPWHTDLVVPESLAEANRLIDASAQVSARVFAVRDPATERLIAVADSPFENLFAPLLGKEKFEPRARADPLQAASWKSLLGGVVQRRPTGPAEPFAATPLEILFAVPDRGTLVVGVDDTVDPAQVRIRGLPLHWTIPRGHALARSLRDALDRPLQRALEERGVAFGRAGLDALPADTTGIRLYAAQPADLAVLPRFASLTRVDLAGSPAAATPAGLLQLQRCPKIRSLVLPAAGIGAAHLDAVVALPELDELFVGALMGDLMLRPGRDTANTIDDRCAAILARASQLRELSLPNTGIGDTGLAALSALPLRTLMIGSPRLTGTGFAAFADSSTLRDVTLVGCEQLQIDGLRALGGTASRTGLEVYLCEVRVPAGGAAALLGAGRIRELGLVRCVPATTWPALLTEIASVGVERLTLSLGDGLRLDDLAHLAGTEGLRGIEAAVPRGEPIPTEVVARVRAALPGVSLDVWHGPR